MSGRLPHDAFQYYFALGSGRSYQQVADHFGVTKRSVTKLATKKGWQEKVEDLEARSRQQSEKKALETCLRMSDHPWRGLQGSPASLIGSSTRRESWI